MDEIRFVVKCLVFACLVFAGSQYRLDDGMTIEARAHEYLVSSTVADFVNESARGGAKLVQKFYQEVSVYAGGKEPQRNTTKKKQVDTEDDIDLE